MTISSTSYADQCVASAVWAAFGDALGFISELASADGIRQRTGKDHVEGLIPWRRRIGGRFGVEADLPAGCYSDDTQLRLATGRAIGAEADFDIEAFAKVELPVFTSYALGAGRGTLASAENLRRGSVSWWANFHARYTEGGGNGSAMRIHPHVWARGTKAHLGRLLLDVAKNTAATHGHPRAFVGAAFHALLLDHCMRTRQVPGPESWSTLLAIIHSDFVKSMRSDLHFTTAWLPEWERLSGHTFEDGVRATVAELYSMQALLQTEPRRKPSEHYRHAVKTLGGTDPATRGSATITTVLAGYLAWLFADTPRSGLIECVNTLGSDTDTIASMAGALLGAVGGRLPEEHVSDQGYIEREARRLAAIATENSCESFGYPNLLDWTPPRTSLDTVGYLEDGRTLSIAGLGRLEAESSPIELRGKSPARLQWGILPFGQKVLVKMRVEPRVLDTSQRGTEDARGKRPVGRVGDNSPRVLQEPTDNFGTINPQHSENSRARSYVVRSSGETVDEATQLVIASGFNPHVVGEGFLRMVEGPHGIENAIGFAAIVAKAKLARARRGPQPLSLIQQDYLEKIEQDPEARVAFLKEILDWLTSPRRTSPSSIQDTFNLRTLAHLLAQKGIR